MVAPFQVPVVIVPKVVMEFCPTYVEAMSTVGVVAPFETVTLFAVPLTKVTVPPEELSVLPDIDKPVPKVISETPVPPLDFEPSKRL